MIYDITIPLRPGMPVWPGDPEIEARQAGDGVRLSRWALGSHSGTHVDAPSHYLPDGATVEELPLEALLGPCLLLDLSGIPLITARDLARRDLGGARRLLLRTAVPGGAFRPAPPNFDPSFSGLTPDAARYLLDRGVILLGTDAPSIEPFGADGETHRLLLSAGVVLLEWLGLSRVPCGSYDLICAPLKLEKADGAPARAFLVARGS